MAESASKRNASQLIIESLNEVRRENRQLQEEINNIKELLTKISLEGSMASYGNTKVAEEKKKEIVVGDGKPAAAKPKAGAKKKPATAAAFYKLRYSEDQAFRDAEKARVTAIGVDLAGKVVGPANGDLTKEAAEAYKLLNKNKTEKERITAAFAAFKVEDAPKPEPVVDEANMPEAP